MDFINFIITIPLFLIVMVVFLPIANGIMTEMTGLFNPATFVALNSLIVIVVFVGIYSIINNLNKKEGVSNA